MPNPGPQTLAYYSLADELLFGGAAGGGKTDLLIGAASTAHKRSIIFRREHKQTRGVEERLMELLVDSIPCHGRYNKSDHEFWSHERGGYKIELGGVKDPGDEKKWHGRPHDLKGFDELTDFTQYQYTYLNIWKRSTVPGQRTRTIACTNPPTDEDGMWVIDYWAPWISKNYLGKRAEPGELRWYITTADGQQFEVEAGERTKYKGKEYDPKSRTFIPSLVSDNMFYAGTGYESQLAMLPPELRDKFLGGDFMAGITADPMQLVPREWVEMAQARWRQRPKPSTPPDQLGVDIAHGGRDQFVVTPRHENYIAEQIRFPVDIHKSGVTAAIKLAELMQYSGTVAALDVVGVGASCSDHLMLIKPGRVLAMNGAAKAGGQRDASGLLGFVNARALWHWRVREAFDPASGTDLAIPPDPELLKEICAIKWKLTSTGIKVEEKDDIKSRLGRSPDRFDSLMYSLNQPTIAGAGLLGLYAQEVEQSSKATSPDSNVIRIGSP